MNLRELAEADLAFTLEGDFGLPVLLIGPDGATQSVSAQIVYDTIVEDPSSGAQQIVHKPVVTVRRSSLTTVPSPGEVWSVRLPLTPDEDAAKATYLIERASEDGGSIGFVRLYCMKAEQS